MSKKSKKPSKPQGSGVTAPLFHALKTRHRAERENYDAAWAQNFSLRIHRALSWLHKAELADDDADMRFIALWIGFNSAYTGDAGGQVAGRNALSERSSVQGFLDKICRLDDDDSLKRLLLQLASGPVRNLLDNEYLFQPYWDYIHGKADAQEWQQRFAQEKKRLHEAVLKQDSAAALGFVFERLYTLRNQLLHGGATWGGAMNREQLRLANSLLLSVLPAMLGIMLQQPAQFAAPPFYPPVGA